MAVVRTAAWWIHHKYYRCSIRNADIAAREEHKYGYRRAGVSDMDDQGVCRGHESGATDHHGHRRAMGRRG